MAPSVRVFEQEQAARPQVLGLAVAGRHLNGPGEVALQHAERGGMGHLSVPPESPPTSATVTAGPSVRIRNGGAGGRRWRAAAQAAWLGGLLCWPGVGGPWLW